MKNGNPIAEKKLIRGSLVAESMHGIKIDGRQERRVKYPSFVLTVFWKQFELMKDARLQSDSDQRGGLIPILLLLLPFLYCLSPPIVASMMPGNYWESEAFSTIYMPLIWLSEKSEVINRFYEFYFGLFPWL